MKLFIKSLGLGLMVVGVLLLVLQHVLHFTFINELLLLSLLLIIVGLVWHVWMMKREGRY